jgi:HEAT repeat protein
VLPPERIKPYLLHEDVHVRRAAAEYLGDSRSRDPEIIPLILDACERYDDPENIRGLAQLDRLLMTEVALDRVLGHLARASEANVISHLNRAIALAPGVVLAARESAVRETPNVFPETLARVEHRRDLVSWSGERIWEELRDVARRFKEEDDTGEIDGDYADDLIEALACHNVPDAKTVCDLLVSLEPEEGWLEIFLADLAGRRRIAEAVPILIRKLEIDADYLVEEAREALARIGDPEACRLIREAYPGTPEHFRWYAPDVLGSIKRPESEDAILACLEAETDESIRTYLCIGLCGLFSERGIEVVRREIVDGYDDSITNLEDELLPVLDVLGLELPETDRWRKERAERERRLAQRLAELEEMDRRFAERRSVGPSAAAGWDQRTVPVEDFPEVTEPIRRTGERVGRNDPCPCGSGKKFKKCCGRNA